MEVESRQYQMDPWIQPDLEALGFSHGQHIIVLRQAVLIGHHLKEL